MKTIHQKRILIVGAGVAGRELLRELTKRFKKHYLLIGLIDDDPKKQGVSVNGVKVLGQRDELKSILKEHKIDEVFIAIPSAKGDVIKDIIFKCKEAGVVFRIVPRILEIIQGKVKLEQIRDVEIEDLLGRPPVKAQQQIFINEFSGKKILVTGAAGSIGSELCRQLVQFNPASLIAVDWWENGLFELQQQLLNIAKNGSVECIIASIQDELKLQQVFKKYKPEIVFHAAAYKHVPLMQSFPEEAVTNNIFGTLAVAKVSIESGVKKYVLISTDKAVDPTSVMGTTKAIAEKVIKSLNSKGKTKFMAVRFGNVLGSNGSVVQTFKKQIASGGPVSVTDPDMVRYFMTISEAVQLVLQASIMGLGGEIFILEMGQQIKIVDLARMMITLAGFIPDEEIIIKYVGLRPGEKMYEELTTSSETMEKTAHPYINKVLSTKEAEYDLSELLAKLKESSQKKDRKDIYKLLKKVAPNLQLIS
jgi:FlaA1/EpsC-like NDP-sugar epimerase